MFVVIKVESNYFQYYTKNNKKQQYIFYQVSLLFIDILLYLVLVKKYKYFNFYYNIQLLLFCFLHVTQFYEFLTIIKIFITFLVQIALQFIIKYYYQIFPYQDREYKVQIYQNKNLVYFLIFMIIIQKNQVIFLIQYSKYKKLVYIYITFWYPKLITSTFYIIKIKKKYKLPFFCYQIYQRIFIQQLQKINNYYFDILRLF
eukprot:TRINITY_DN3241_c0_g2_i2.p5 TRINITY_DN3241_c0_g2~~TRINITY_DN3241_c0_g2_i2.p5  ORF type:complete len:201 (-),score=-10.86 TRINITY_DN3241_c0_g2_i2:485-1087(-)